ncbi:MAG: hypothetical protein JOZ15_21655 [Acidobacteria bacterium]|nr:hypothetical protein [Acidobacteriota bacterium]
MVHGDPGRAGEAEDIGREGQEQVDAQRLDAAADHELVTAHDAAQLHLDDRHRAGQVEQGAARVPVALVLQGQAGRAHDVLIEVDELGLPGRHACSLL